MKTVLWILLYAVVFVVTFAGSFVLGIAVPASRYNKPLQVEWTSDVGTELLDLPYEQGLSYDLYIPAGLDQQKGQSLILFIHGGGFTSGTKKDEAQWCKFFASKGYITAAASYPLMSEGNTTNLNEMNDKLLLCVGKIVEECQSRGYQLTEMATSGHSAGGCLAMLYAYRNIETSPLPVRFVFQQTGPASFEPSFWGGGDDASVAASLSGWSGKTVTAQMVADGSHQIWLDEISPAALINANTVPTLCAYGPKDKVVPVDIKFALFDAFEQHGVIYDYIEFPNSGHGMMCDPDRQSLFVQKALQYCKDYFLN